MNRYNYRGLSRKVFNALVSNSNNGVVKNLHNKERISIGAVWNYLIGKYPECRQVEKQQVKATLYYLEKHKNLINLTVCGKSDRNKKEDLYIIKVLEPKYKIKKVKIEETKSERKLPSNDRYVNLSTSTNQDIIRKVLESEEDSVVVDFKKEVLPEALKALKASLNTFGMDCCFNQLFHAKTNTLREDPTVIHFFKMEE